MFLTGTFTRSLDEKLRIAIPKPLRDALADQPDRPLFVAPGTDGSLAVYPEGAFAEMAQRLAGASPTAKDVRDYSRLFFARAVRTRIDRQGRLRVPKELAELCQLGEEVVLLGVQDHFELWPKDRWNRYLDERRERYDHIAEAAFSVPPLPANRTNDTT